MKASEGKLGRVFLLRLEGGDDPAQVIPQFALDKEIYAAQVFAVSKRGLTGILAPDADGHPGLRLPEEAGDPTAWADAEVIVQELTGIAFRRVRDAAGRETFARVPSTKTRVMERPAPLPEVAGPGTVPVYLFNAEIN